MEFMTVHSLPGAHIEGLPAHLFVLHRNNNKIDHILNVNEVTRLGAVTEYLYFGTITRTQQPRNQSSLLPRAIDVEKPQAESQETPIRCHSSGGFHEQLISPISTDWVGLHILVSSLVGPLTINGRRRR